MAFSDGSTNTPPCILTIAGSDSGGGAGIQSDLRTFNTLGAYGCSAITVVTAQNTQEVVSLYALPVEVIKAQIVAVLEDIGANAIKTGMLGSAEIVQLVAQCLIEFQAKNKTKIPFVIDTVLKASTGTSLSTQGSSQDLASSMAQFLFPLASLVTPNLDEAAVFLGLAPNTPVTRADLPNMAQALLDLGCEAVLLKGGHLQDYAEHKNLLVDYYLDKQGQSKWFEHPRHDSRNTHGTGCTLSAAIAAHLGSGLPMLKAIEQGIKYTEQAILAGAEWRIGQGNGPLGVPYNPNKKS